MDYVADKTHTPPGEMTAEELRTALAPRVGDELASRAADCVSACDLGRFGGEAVDAGEIVGRLKGVLTELERSRL